MTSHNSPDELRNLWQSQRSELVTMSVEQLRQASHKLTRNVFWRNFREYVAVLIVVVGYGYYFYKFHTVLLRLGSATTIVGALFVALQLRKKGSPATMAKEMDAKSCLEFHRAELVRQRDLLLAVWRWYLLPLVPGLSLFFLGQVQLALIQSASHPHQGKIALGFGLLFAACAAVFFVIGKLNHWAANKIQRKIDALDVERIDP